MASSLKSLNVSLTHFVKNEYGLSEDVEYFIAKTGTTIINLKAVKESKGFKRKITAGVQADYDTFLITLNFIPSKNDKLIINSIPHYVDMYDIISFDNYRLYCEAKVEIIPETTARFEV